MNVVLSSCLLAASAVMISGCHSDDTSKTVAVETTQARVVQSRQQQVPQWVPSTGTVHARETAIVSAQVPGRIQQVLVREGDSVRAGQTLVVLDDATMRASAAQAEAGVKAAEGQQAAAETNAKLAASTLERYRQLQAEKSVSPQEMDEVSRRSEGASASLEAARAQAEATRAQESNAHTILGYTRVMAPFAGLVTARMADPGTLASPGVPLLQIDQAGPLQLDATVDESSIASIHKGMKLPVAIGGGTMTGVVDEIVPVADPASHSFMVKIDLPPSSQLRAGMYGTTSFASGSRAAILIPHTAVVLRGSLSCAYVLDAQGIAQLRYLTLGAEHGDLIEVLSGISADERLVDAPSDRDLAGKKIEAQP